MRRALALCLVVLAALAAAVPVAAGAAPLRALQFEVQADGFRVQGRSILGSGRVRLLLYRRGEVAAYNVPARIGTATVQARFGRLGSLDFAFVPAGRRGLRHCEGGRRPGTFEGSLVFHGEHHYADIDVGRARGWFQAGCPGAAGGGLGPVTGAATASQVGPTAETGVRLAGLTSHHLPFRFFEFFTESGPAGVRVSFSAFRAEHREGMQIDRGAELYGGARTFDWNLVAGTATLEPPAPFSGRAFFRREPGGRSRWWGSLRAPILGGSPMRLTGAAFDARLGPNT